MKQVQAANFDALITNGIWSVDYLCELQKLGVPLVSCDKSTRGMSIDSVSFSGAQAGEAAAKLLLRYGHKDILFVTGMRRDFGAPAGADPVIEDETSAERRTGVQQGLVGSDADLWPYIPWTAAPGQDGPKLLAARFERIISDMQRLPTAMVTVDAGIALAVKTMLESMGLGVPHDVSILTFAAPPAKGAPARFSGMCYDWHEMAQEAWRLLKERLDGLRPANAPAVNIELSATYLDQGTVRNLRSANSI